MKTLITGRIVRTPDGTRGNSVLVAGGVVAAVGASMDLARPEVEVHDFGDAVVVPGLRDAHFHPVAYAAAARGLSLDGIVDVAGILDAVRAASARLDPGRPLVALRLDDQSLAERRLPTAAELTAAAGDRPVLVHRYCGHVAVANQAALALAGIDGSTPDPEGGVIDRGEDGRPTGGLRETAVDRVALALSRHAGPALAPADVARALNRLAALGITSIGAMVRHGEGAWATLGDESEILAEAAVLTSIKQHCFVIADSPETFMTVGRRLAAAGPRIRWQGLKRFGDGSFGGHTAAMHAPFADRETSGTLRLGEVDETMIRFALTAGKDVAIHAIGDRAVTRVIDLVEQLEEYRGSSIVRIEHASVIRPADVSRMASLRIIGSVQPSFLGSETGWLEERIGSHRLPFTYAFRTMSEAGVTLAGGSDCPVEDPDPWSGMALARDRAGIHPPECLQAEEAFRLYTSGAAAALGEPPPLAVGSPADLVVIDRDPVTVTPDELRATKVLATYVDGEQLEITAGPLPWPG